MSDKKPAYVVYVVSEREEKEDHWLRVGAAFAHEDGKGFTLAVDAFPAAGGRLVLRRPKD